MSHEDDFRAHIVSSASNAHASGAAWFEPGRRAHFARLDWFHREVWGVTQRNTCWKTDHSKVRLSCAVIAAECV
jgi:hypothetical protein